MKENEIYEIISNYSYGRIDAETFEEALLEATEFEKVFILDKVIEKTAEIGSDVAIKETDPLHKDRKYRYSWGTDNLDKTIPTIEDYSYVVFAGRESSGKTFFCFDLAVKNARKGIPVLYISLEMSKSAVITRICKEHAGITIPEWRDKSTIPSNKKEKYLQRRKELEDLEELNFWGTERGDMTMEELLIGIKKAEPGIVFIDNLGLVNMRGFKDLWKAQAAASNLILRFTNKTQIPVVLVAHLGKGSSAKGGTEGLAGSSQIKNDADMVLYCGRNQDESVFFDEGFDDLIKRDGSNQLEEYEKAELKLLQSKFYVFIKKDRETGSGGLRTLYFENGKFSDGVKEEQPGFETF